MPSFTKYLQINPRDLRKKVDRALRLWYTCVCLVCDEAGDCCPKTGNFRRVCPKIGRRNEHFLRGVHGTPGTGVQIPCLSQTQKFKEAKASNGNKRENQNQTEGLRSHAHRSGGRKDRGNGQAQRRRGFPGRSPLPTDREIITILRAVHKYKDSREQFELRTHKRLIDIIKPSQKAVEALMGMELPAGVDIEIKL